MKYPTEAPDWVAAASRRAAPLAVLVLALALGACGSLPDKPTRAAMYDFGPGAAAAPAATGPAALPALAPLALADVETSGGALDNMAVLYRLAYADAQQLRPYAQARWSMPAAQLVRQRLRDTLSLQRAVFRAGEGPALTKVQGVLPLVLRVELEEFSHYFESPSSSFGLIRLRATLIESTPAGERQLAQRQVVVRQVAATADAPGGVKALTAATDAAALEISGWLQQLPRS